MIVRKISNTMLFKVTITITMMHTMAPQVEGGTSGVCNLDGKTDSCGVYQIKETYWKDCGQPGGSEL